MFTSHYSALPFGVSSHHDSTEVPQVEQADDATYHMPICGLSVISEVDSTLESPLQTRNGELEAASNVLTVFLKPGKLGMEAIWETGQITKVAPGCQAHCAGVKAGMWIRSIDRTAYSEDFLETKVAGICDYCVTFARPEDELHTRSPAYNHVTQATASRERNPQYSFESDSSDFASMLGTIKQLVKKAEHSAQSHATACNQLVARQGAQLQEALGTGGAITGKQPSSLQPNGIENMRCVANQPMFDSGALKSQQREISKYQRAAEPAQSAKPLPSSNSSQSILQLEARLMRLECEAPLDSQTATIKFNPTYVQSSASPSRRLDEIMGQAASPTFFPKTMSQVFGTSHAVREQHSSPAQNAAVCEVAALGEATAKLSATAAACQAEIAAVSGLLMENTPQSLDLVDKYLKAQSEMQDMLGSDSTLTPPPAPRGTPYAVAPSDFAPQCKPVTEAWSGSPAISSAMRPQQPTSSHSCDSSSCGSDFVQVSAVPIHHGLLKPAVKPVMPEAPQLRFETSMLEKSLRFEDTDYPDLPPLIPLNTQQPALHKREHTCNAGEKIVPSHTEQPALHKREHTCDAGDKIVEQWSEEDVCIWLSSITEIPTKLFTFIYENAINGVVLLSLTDLDIKGLPLPDIEHQRILTVAARELQVALGKRSPQPRAPAHLDSVAEERHLGAAEERSNSHRPATKSSVSRSASSQCLSTSSREGNKRQAPAHAPKTQLSRTSSSPSVGGSNGRRRQIVAELHSPSVEHPRPPPPRARSPDRPRQTVAELRTPSVERPRPPAPRARSPDRPRSSTWGEPPRRSSSAERRATKLAQATPQVAAGGRTSVLPPRAKSRAASPPPRAGSPQRAVIKVPSPLKRRPPVGPPGPGRCAAPNSAAMSRSRSKGSVSPAPPNRGHEPPRDH